MFRVIIGDLVANMALASKHARRWDQHTLELFTVLCIKGGPACCTFLVSNIGGPCESTYKLNQRRDHHVLLADFSDANVIFSAGFYGQVLRTADKPQGCSPFSVAVDETVINPGLHVDGSMNFLVGSCGLKGTAEADHFCKSKWLRIRSGEEGYEDIKSAFENQTMAHCA